LKTSFITTYANIFDESHLEINLTQSTYFRTVSWLCETLTSCITKIAAIIRNLIIGTAKPKRLTKTPAATDPSLKRTVMTDHMDSIKIYPGVPKKQGMSNPKVGSWINKLMLITGLTKPGIIST